MPRAVSGFYAASWWGGTAEWVPRQPGCFDRHCETLFYWNTDFIMKIAGVVCF